MELPFSRRYRHFQRYREIAQIFVANGLGFIISNLDLDRYLPFKERINTEKKISGQRLAEQFRNVLQDLGPTYIKLGQLLSTRADMLPLVFIKELKKLQDDVKPEKFTDIEEVIKTELGDDFQKIDKIIKKPIAAASIAQTHRIILKDGRQLIMKVRRPNISKKIKVDLEIMANMAKLAQENNLLTGFIRPLDIVEQFSRTINKEINFNNEIANISLFKENFKDDPLIIAPKVFNEFSTNKIITMEEIKGERLNNIDASHPKNSHLAELGAKTLMKQVLIHGFFHADPHPGNIFIVDSNKLAYLDFGIVGRLTERDKDLLGILFYALVTRKMDIILDLILILGEAPPDLNKKQLRLDLMRLFDKYYGNELSELSFQLVFDDVQQFIYEHKIQMPQEFFLLFRAIGVSEGVGLTLDPGFNAVRVGKEFIRQLAKDRFGPNKLKERLLSFSWNGLIEGREISIQIRQLLQKLSEDDFTIQFKHTNLDPIITEMDVITNRLSISLIISALIIGSTLLTQTNMDPKIFNIPLLGFLGYTMAGLLGFWLVISILRSGKF